MKCAWQAYINLLPSWMRQEVERYENENLQEIRIRTGLQPEMILSNGNRLLSRRAVKEDISFVINIASEYSPWSTQTAKYGYITAPGGHRIGICGVAAVSNKDTKGISIPTSLCIRVAKDFAGIAKSVSHLRESILIIGPPGSGKTTLLRDLIRCKSDSTSENVSVVDEREEIFPLYKGQACFAPGKHTDILSGTEKDYGIKAVLRSMNPDWIAVDEITSEHDCIALLNAGWCGVNLIATAHAGSITDLNTRPVYKPLLDHKLFPNIIVLRKNKTWTYERIL